MEIKRYCIWKNKNTDKDFWNTIRDNPDKPWDWNYLSENPNITWEIVRDNPDKPWNYTDLSKNKFLYNETVNKRYRTKDIKLRYNSFKIIFEPLSALSRNIDRTIKKRFNYR